MSASEARICSKALWGPRNELRALSLCGDAGEGSWLLEKVCSNRLALRGTLAFGDDVPAARLHTDIIVCRLADLCKRL